MSSFRAQFRLYTVALIAALLGGFNVVVYTGFHSLLQQYVDGRLFGFADTLAELIEQRPELLKRSDHEIVVPRGAQVADDRMKELREVSHSVHILALDGTVVWQGSGVVPRPSVDEAVLARGKRGEVVYETLEMESGLSVRQVFVPIRQQDEVRYLLQAEESLAFFRRTHRSLMGLLMLGSVAVLATSWFGSGWLARKVLDPVEALSRTAEGISESALRSRANLNAPFEEFERLAQAFNAMLDRLQRASESQRRFTDYAAHEMKTPLTVMQGNLEVALQRSRSADDYRDVLVSNLEQVQRLIVLTRSLLTLARFAGERPPVELSVLALQPLLKELIDDLTPVAEDRHLTLVLEEEPVPPILGDAERLKQVFINLLDNALRYTDPGGTVALTLRSEQNQVRVAVRDTGQGIAREHLPHLFEPFYRTDPARARDSGGHGLGLPIVKEIVEAHHGAITVESDVGKGSVFMLTFPAIQT
ncbi:MAG TPA: ATP-binding protein [Nitrospira sp.]|nr:ATP-binding protein [Nitrospira sp.]